jgi:hypothetical protein
MFSNFGSCCFTDIMLATHVLYLYQRLARPDMLWIILLPRKRFLLS